MEDGTEKKLNKNQLSFFEEAIPYFGLGARAAKYADITKFAEIRALTVPISFLKDHCKTDKRGTYDLNQSGIVIDDEAEITLIDLNLDDSDPDSLIVVSEASPIILEQSAYAEPEDKKVPSMFKSRDPIKRKFHNPVYIVQDMEGEVRSVCDSPKAAYKKANNVLHGGFSMTERQATDALLKYGLCFITCTNAVNLKVKISKVELNE
jgi:hypothetical protein